MARTSRQRSKPPPITTYWFTKPEMVRIFGRARQTFDGSIEPYFPTDHNHMQKRETDGEMMYHARRCIEAWAQANLGESDRNPKPEPMPSTKELLQVRELQLKLHERSGAFVPRSDVVEMHNEMATVLREGAKEMERRFGRDAADLYDGLLTSVERTLRNRLAETNGSDNGATRL